MIVKDEDLFLRDCLQSVADIVDEIIVVDTGSTDQTVQIARQFGARVVHQNWENHFGQARNRSLDHAVGEWILILDADERFPPGHAAAIRDFLSRADARVEGVLLQIRNYFGEGKPDQYAVDTACRVFRNRSEYRYSSPLHEEMSKVILRQRPQAALFSSELYLNHLGYLRDVLERKQKSRRNMEILRQALAAGQADPFLYYAYGTEYFQQEDYQTALQYYRKAVALSPALPDFGADLYYKMAISLMKAGALEEALELTNRFLRIEPDFSSLWYVKGELHYLREEWEAAKSAFRWCLEIGAQPDKHLYIHGLDSFHTYWSIGKVYEKEENDEKAVEYYILSLDANQEYQPALEGLYRIFERQITRAVQYLELYSDTKYGVLKSWLERDGLNAQAE